MTTSLPARFASLRFKHPWTSQDKWAWNSTSRIPAQRRVEEARDVRSISESERRELCPVAAGKRRALRPFGGRERHVLHGRAPTARKPAEKGESSAPVASTSSTSSESVLGSPESDGTDHREGPRDSSSDTVNLGVRQARGLNRSWRVPRVLGNG